MTADARAPRWSPAAAGQRTRAAWSGGLSPRRSSGVRTLRAGNLPQLALFQHPPENLAGRRLGDGVDELHIARNLVVRETALDEGDDVAGRQLATRLSDHEGLGDLARLGMRLADHRGVGDRG